MPAYSYGEVVRDKRGNVVPSHGLQTFDRGMLRRQPEIRATRLMPQAERFYGRLFAIGVSHRDASRQTAGRLSVNQQVPTSQLQLSRPRPAISIPLQRATSAYTQKRPPTRTKVYSQGLPSQQARYAPIGGKMVRVYPCG